LDERSILIRLEVLEEEVERLRRENLKVKQALSFLEKRVLDAKRMGEVYEAARIAGRLELERRKE
jgi:hypothetical protein